MKIYVGHQKCVAYDDIDVKPCYICGRYGHKGKNVGIPHVLRALNVQVHIKQVNVVQTSRNVQTVYTVIRNTRQTTTSTRKQ